MFLESEPGIHADGGLDVIDGAGAQGAADFYLPLLEYGAMAAFTR